MNKVILGAGKALFANFSAALSLLSLVYVLTVASIVKLLVYIFYAPALLNPTVKAFFQLSVFLFIPVMIVLHSSALLKPCFEEASTGRGDAHHRLLKFIGMLLICILVFLFGFLLIGFSLKK